jgi:hypothetical protein
MTECSLSALPTNRELLPFVDTNAFTITYPAPILSSIIDLGRNRKSDVVLIQSIVISLH